MITFSVRDAKLLSRPISKADLKNVAGSRSPGALKMVMNGKSSPSTILYDVYA